MMELRGLHCMCTVGDRLYVMGGNHFRGSSDYDDVLDCEFYSPEVRHGTGLSFGPNNMIGNLTTFSIPYPFPNCSDFDGHMSGSFRSFLAWAKMMTKQGTNYIRGEKRNSVRQLANQNSDLIMMLSQDKDLCFISSPRWTSGQWWQPCHGARVMWGWPCSRARST